MGTYHADFQTCGTSVCSCLAYPCCDKTAAAFILVFTVGLLYAGDKLVEVNGVPVEGLEPEQVINILVLNLFLNLYPTLYLNCMLFLVHTRAHTCALRGESLKFLTENSDCFLTVDEVHNYSLELEYMTPELNLTLVLVCECDYSTCSFWEKYWFIQTSLIHIFSRSSTHFIFHKKVVERCCFYKSTRYALKQSKWAGKLHHSSWKKRAVVITVVKSHMKSVELSLYLSFCSWSLRVFSLWSVSASQ